MPDLEEVLNGQRSGEGRLVRVHMSVVETMDPEYYAGAVQRQDGQWICCKYGNNQAISNPKQIKYWERIPVGGQL